MNPMIDVINLQEGNNKINAILKANPDFYLYGDFQDTNEDQCLTLIRKSIPIIPQDYPEIYRQ